MTEKRHYKALISGGGTGGHIFPALSIANALHRRYPDIEIMFVGADNRMEMTRVPEAGYPIIGLPVSGFDRKNLLRNVKVLWDLYKSMRMARKVVKDFNPDIAIGVGGYCSGPTLKAAQKAGVPTVLQEQNSYAGVTNKLLAQKAKAICVAYEGMDKFFPAETIHLTGNPIRENLLHCPLTQEQAKIELGFDPLKPLVLVVGGSLGARTINEAIEVSMDRILAEKCQILWQTGKYNADHFALCAFGKEGIKATNFISDMATAYRAADLVVSRAGAGTISELQVLAKPVVLVPSPNVAEDHQRKNAQALVDNNAAIMILDADAKRELGGEILELLKDKSKRDLLAENISKMALRNSDEEIVNIISKIIENKL